MISFKLPETKLPQDFKNIYKNLKKLGILGEYMPRLNFPDEPQFFQYACERKVGLPHIKSGYGYGSGESKIEAITSAIAEAIEHYCILFEREELFIRGSYADFGDKAINPNKFSVFSESQLMVKEFEKFFFDENSAFNWVKGYSVTQKKEVLVPAQLIYAAYDSVSRKEPIIRIPISTGAACGPSLDFAFYRGLCETIERDAYMITYLNKLDASLINIEEDRDLTSFKKRIERYSLEVYFIETKLDFSMESVVAIILDKTGIGPAVTAGLGGSLNPTKAIVTSALEAVRRHIAVRDRFFRSDKLRMPGEDTVDGVLYRKQLLWSAPHMLNKIKTFISGPEKPFSSLINVSRRSDKENVDVLMKDFISKGYEVILVDVTTSEVKNVGLHVVKVLIPELLPLYHDERFPYKKNFRLYNISKQLGKRKDTIKEKDIDSSHPF